MKIVKERQSPYQAGMNGKGLISGVLFSCVMACGQSSPTSTPQTVVKSDPLMEQSMWVKPDKLVSDSGGIPERQLKIRHLEISTNPTLSWEEMDFHSRKRPPQRFIHSPDYFQLGPTSAGWIVGGPGTEWSPFSAFPEYGRHNPAAFLRHAPRP